MGAAAARIMSGAWPPPAPSVWYVWIVLPAMAARVSSHTAAFVKGICMNGYLYVIVVCHIETVINGSGSRTPVFVKFQSPWLRLLICSTRAFSSEQFPLPKSPMFIGYSSQAFNIISMFQGPGVQVVALVVAVCRTCTAADHRGDAAVYRAHSTCCGEMKWIWVSSPPAVRDQAFTSQGFCGSAYGHSGSYPVHNCRVSGLADACDLSVFNSDICFVDPCIIQDQGVGDHQIQISVGAGGLYRLAHGRRGGSCRRRILHSSP